jgi:hypothetical protein
MRRAIQPQADPSHVLADMPKGARATRAEGAIRVVVREQQGERDRSGRGEAPSWEVSDHAVARYIGRVMRGRPVAEARADLLWMLERAHFVKALPSGLELWRGPKPLRLRMRIDGKLLVTVLTDCDSRQQE